MDVWRWGVKMAKKAWTYLNKWKVKYQLVPLDMHRRNTAERAIRTCKCEAHFISMLAGVDDDFPSHLWDLLVPQAEMTQNLLRPCMCQWSNNICMGKLQWEARLQCNTFGANGYWNLNTLHNKPPRENHGTWTNSGNEQMKPQQMKQKSHLAHSPK